MTSRHYRQALGAALVGVAVLCTASCTSSMSEGRSPSYLVIDQLQASSGAKATELKNFLESDVVTVVDKVESVFEDAGTVTMHVQLKDPGSTASPNKPSSVNSVTITRYRVSFVRSDGRNTQGVDVPYGFDGAATGTITEDSVSLSFPLVRVQAKMEAPLLQLRYLGGASVISTIANITFYGKDQAGNEVSVTGSISVNFADWGDPS